MLPMLLAQAQGAGVPILGPDAHDHGLESANGVRLGSEIGQSGGAFVGPPSLHNRGPWRGTWSSSDGPLLPHSD